MKGGIDPVSVIVDVKKVEVFYFECLLSGGEIRIYVFWNGSKSLGGPLILSFGNLGVVGDLLGGSVVTDGHGNFNCFRGPDVMKKKFPSKPDTANESLLGFRGIEGSVCYSRYSVFVVVILSMLNQIPPYFLESLRQLPPPDKSGSGSGSRSGTGSGSGRKWKRKRQRKRK